jgi:uncharacterized protein YndB with AHSA1/START domain
MDARVGGTYKMSLTNFRTGHGHSFGGEYLELVPNERIRHTDRVDDPNLPGTMTIIGTDRRGHRRRRAQPNGIPVGAWRRRFGIQLEDLIAGRSPERVCPHSGDCDPNLDDGTASRV